MNEEDFILVGWIIRSSYRVKVLQALKENEYLTPTSISKETGINKYHISNILRGLKEKFLIKCLNEEQTKGRIYVLTENGDKILNIINDIK